jgi:chloramphenicol-sensitive protein RarD
MLLHCRAVPPVGDTTFLPRLPTSEGSSATAVMYALLAYGAWGVLPVYWKIFVGIPATEVLAHRMVWALPFTLALLLAARRMGEFIDLVKRPRRLALMVLTSSILALNWGTYIYGVNTDRIVETSLGYFINPLVNVALGFLFLKERFNRWQVAALALASLGVGIFIWSVGTLPWIALTLAVSFGFYGLLRKLAPAGPLPGLAAETLVLAPVACLYLAVLHRNGQSHFGQDSTITLALAASGAVTALPLLWFAQAARRMRLSTVGLFQYMAPTMQLLLGVFLYKEPFTQAHVITFSCIWVALAIYSGSALAARRQLARQSPLTSSTPGNGMQTRE